MGLARAKAAESYRQQKMEFLKEKLKIQEEERKNLVNMAEYATRMTQAADAKGIEENIIQSLSQAIGALRRISVILRNNAQFWTQMATACEKLGGQKTEGLRRDINRYKGKPERLCVATSRVADPSIRPAVFCVTAHLVRGPGAHSLHIEASACTRGTVRSSG